MPEEEIFEIISCIEILAEDLHPLGGRSVLNMYLYLTHYRKLNDS